MSDTPTITIQAFPTDGGPAEMFMGTDITLNGSILNVTTPDDHAAVRHVVDLSRYGFAVVTRSDAENPADLSDKTVVKMTLAPATELKPFLATKAEWSVEKNRPEFVFTDELIQVIWCLPGSVRSFQTQPYSALTSAPTEPAADDVEPEADEAPVDPASMAAIAAPVLTPADSEGGEA